MAPADLHFADSSLPYLLPGPHPGSTAAVLLLGQIISTEFTYVIERYGVGGATEELLQRAELIRAGGGLACRVEGQERLLDAADVPAAITSDPTLCEIRANQVTRITATGAAYDHLPLLLTVPGDPEDFDESAWSDTLAEEHTEEVWVIQPGRCRVLYVNDERWGCWQTAHGARMLPQDWPMILLSSVWGHLSFSELMSMTSGLDQMSIGLATPGVVAACFHPDMGVGYDERAETWKRGDPASDARLFVDWLLDWSPEGWGIEDENFKALLAQLFVEAMFHDRNSVPTSGAMLAAGFENKLVFGDADSSEWSLAVGLEPETVQLALDALAERGPRFADIVIAARDPDSPQAANRRAALMGWEQNHDEHGAWLVEREADYQRQQQQE